MQSPGREQGLGLGNVGLNFSTQQWPTARGCVNPMSKKMTSDLVFACHGIPAHGDASDWAKRDKGFLYLLFASVIVDTTHIDPASDTNQARTVK